MLMDNQMPVMQQPLSVAPAVKAPPVMEEKKGKGGIVAGILAVLFFLTTAVFVGLFIWSKTEYSELEDTVNLKIDEMVSKAKTEQALADAEEAKKDTRTFTGPTDYGQLSFEYPKSWSVYVEANASNGGDFVAYLNPIEIEPISDSTVYALRVSILDRDFESVVTEFQDYLEDEESDLNIESTIVAGTVANRYTGDIPETELRGVIVIFKIRDKTAILRTDSELLINDFNTILNSVKFNA